MENRTSLYYVGEGILRSFVISLILILIYSALMTFVPMTAGIAGTYILIMTLLSIVYGSIYASRKVKRRGWFVGLIVAVGYVIILYIVSIIAGREMALKLSDLYRTLLALAVGILSGMLGINI